LWKIHQRFAENFYWQASDELIQRWFSRSWSNWRNCGGWFCYHSSSLKLQRGFESFKENCLAHGVRNFNVFWSCFAFRDYIHQQIKGYKANFRKSSCALGSSEVPRFYCWKKNLTNDIDSFYLRWVVAIDTKNILWSAADFISKNGGKKVKSFRNNEILSIQLKYCNVFAYWKTNSFTSSSKKPWVCEKLEFMVSNLCFSWGGKDAILVAMSLTWQNVLKVCTEIASFFIHRGCNLTDVSIYE